MNRPLPRTYGRQRDLDRETGGYGGPVEPCEWYDANLVSSKLRDGRHAPALDLDVAAHLVPSRTEGHSHLYIDVPMKWWKYRLLLWVLQFVGIIEPGYYRASVTRGASYLRTPMYRMTEVERSAHELRRALVRERNQRTAFLDRRGSDWDELAF